MSMEEINPRQLKEDEVKWWMMEPSVSDLSSSYSPHSKPCKIPK